MCCVGAGAGDEMTNPRLDKDTVIKHWASYQKLTTWCLNRLIVLKCTVYWELWYPCFMLQQTNSNVNPAADLNIFQLINQLLWTMMLHATKITSWYVAFTKVVIISVLWVRLNVHISILAWKLCASANLQIHLSLLSLDIASVCHKWGENHQNNK